MSSSTSLSSPSRFTPELNEDTLAFVAVAILLSGVVLWSSHLSGVEKTDFSLTYVAARIVHRGQEPLLYDMELQKKTRDSLFIHPSPLFFEHPPLEALLLSPLAALSFRSAYAVWGLLNAAVWLSLIIFLRRYLPWPRELLAYIALWLIFAPLAVALYQGQSSIILLALFAAAFVLLKNARELSAGLALGFGLIKFQFVLPFVLVFVLLRKWRFLAGFILAASVFVALSIATVGFKGMAHYLGFLLTIAANPQNQSYGSAVDMPTIQGFLYAFLGDRIPHTGLITASLLLSVLLLVWIARQWRLATSQSSSDLLFGSAIAASLLAGSHMFTHDLSPLLFSMLLILAHFDGANAKVRVLLVFTMAVFWTFPLYFLCVAYHCLYLMCPVLVLFVFAAVQMAKTVEKNRVVEAGYLKA